MHTIGIPRLLLMEHAGLAVARAVRTILPTPTGECLVCCGSGYNGGDGLCAATHLVQWGYQPRVLVAGALPHLNEEPAIYARILQALHVPVIEVHSQDASPILDEAFRRSALMVDALLGIGLRGPVRPLYAQLIKRMSRAHVPIISVDVPSGLDADTGLPQPIAVRATVTVTFGLPKQGFFVGQGPAHVGRLIVDEIGIPREVLMKGQG